MSDSLQASLAGQNGTDKSRYLIPSVGSAIDILRYLSSTKHMSGTLTQISKDLSLNRSTTYRILTTLELNNMVEYDQSERTYRLGIEVAVLGARVLTLNDFLRRAESVIQKIARETGNTTVMVQRVSYDKIAYVLKAEPGTPIHIAVTNGQVFPITAGSHGKLFMAFMEPDERESILASIGYPKYTDYTIQGETQLKEHLEDIRRTGMSVSWEEHFLGVAGVAVPVLRSGNLIATISCIGMTAGLEKQQLFDWGHLMKKMVDDELA